MKWKTKSGDNLLKNALNFLISEILPKTVLSIDFKASNSLNEGLVGISIEYPYTSAPNNSSQRESQVPLKPVFPVINTFLFLKQLLNKKTHQIFQGAFPELQ